MRRTRSGCPCHGVGAQGCSCGRTRRRAPARAVDVGADEGDEVLVVDAADGVDLGLELVLARLTAGPQQ
jgi:hypothetical protein